MWASMFLPDNTVTLWRDQPRSADAEQWSCIDYVRKAGNNGTIALNDLQNTYQSCHVPTLIEDFCTSTFSLRVPSVS